MGDYHRPETLNEALALLSRPGARIAAGCTDLFPATQACALEGVVIDVTGISALQGITDAHDGLRIGAAATWTDLIRADLPPACDMLKEAAREVGSVQIQNAGTIVGNICNASPAADGVPCLLALDAMVELVSSNGTRQLPLHQFLTGPRQTALRDAEIVTAIGLPRSALRGASRFLKLGARKYLVISIAMVAARVHVQDGRVAEAALCIGACSAVATRVPLVEAALVGQRFDEELPGLVTDAQVASVVSPITDIRADGAYRTHAAAELLRRALADLTSERVTA
ncbi:MAG: FAD binding domain-containing protein [Pseudomonadota bacterium]